MRTRGILGNTVGNTVGDTLGDALVSLKANRLRSMLTTLGIIIGVAAVIVMMAVGNGAKAKVQEMIESLGSNNMMVMPGSFGGGGVRLGSGTLPSLTQDDGEALAQEIPEVAAAAPMVRDGVQVVAGNLNWGTQAQGITADFFTVRQWKVVQGRGFEPGEYAGAAKVALLGQTVVNNIFPDGNALGQTIRVQRVPFKVVGVMEQKGNTSHGMDQDDLVLIPLTTAKKRVLGGRYLGGKRVDNIMVQARSAESVKRAEERVKEVLRGRHGIHAGADDDFHVLNLAEMLSTQASSSEAMSLLLMAVASVSLLVGGIGIMNIMLVSVTERTREIGLRMAVGATARDVLTQFLIEAVVLSLVGGLAGALLGVGGSLALAALSGWPAIIDPASVFLSFSVSAGVGVFFGFYPARKASLLDPIEALRYE